MSLLGGLSLGAGVVEGLLNYKHSRDVYNWQKQAQEKTWRREDNATQRRVADLKKAGLSPTLAAGNAAQASGPITPKTPKSETAAKALQMLSMKADVSKTQAQKELIQAQAEKTQAEKDLISGKTEHQGYENTLKQIEAETAKTVRQLKVPYTSKEGNVHNVPIYVLNKMHELQKAQYVTQQSRALAKSAHVKRQIDELSLRLQKEMGMTKEHASTLAQYWTYKKIKHNTGYAQKFGMPTGMPNKIFQYMGFGNSLMNSAEDLMQK